MFGDLLRCNLWCSLNVQLSTLRFAPQLRLAFHPPTPGATDVEEGESGAHDASADVRLSLEEADEQLEMYHGFQTVGLHPNVKVLNYL